MTNAIMLGISKNLTATLSDPGSFKSVATYAGYALAGFVLSVLAVVTIAAVLGLAVCFVLALVSYFSKQFVRKPKGGFLDVLRTTVQNAFLMLREVVSQRFVSLIVFLSIVIAAFCYGAFNVIGANFNNYINNKFATSIPPNTIKVTPKPAPQVGFLGFALRRPEGTVLNDKYLAKIARIAGVQSVQPIMAMQVPVQAVIGIFEIRYATDLVAIGAPYSLVGKDIANNDYRRMWRDWAPGKDVPMMIPRELLESYNNTLADASGLPHITEQFVMGMKADIYIGKSSLKTIPGFEAIKATMVGFAKDVPMLSVVVPLDVARYYNKKFKGGTSDSEYIYTYVTVKDHDSVLTVSKQLEKWGFIVEVDKTISEDILALKQNVQSVVNVMSIIILFLAVIAVAFSTTIATFNRIGYYRILRILGGSKIYLTLTILIKYALIGFVASFAAVKLVDLAGTLIAQNVAVLLKPLKLAGFRLTLAVEPALRAKILAVGTLIPAASTLPAIILLYVRALNRE